jgi:hypothetical protein
MMGTKTVSGILGVRPGTLARAVWDGRVPEPKRGPGGCFLWDEDDLRRAARAMLGKTLESVLEERWTEHD